MASREFTDSHGAVWTVWDVSPPANLERRMRDDPLLRPEVERRRVPQYRPQLSSPEMARGWLAFQTRGEKRRLAPVPEAWEQMSVSELRGLLARAHPVKPSGRFVE